MHVTVIDVTTGQRHPDQVVVVSGSRISAVGDTVSIPPDAERIDGRGRFLIPGLWDMHVHTAHASRAPYYWPLFIAHGVTGVRDMGTFLDSILYWRSVRDTLHEPAPRVVWGSPIIDGLATYDHVIVVHTPAEGRAIVDSMARLHLGHVKVYGHLSRETYFAIADEGVRMGIPIVGHIPYRVTPTEAARGGQRSVEHLENEVESCTPGMLALNAVMDSVQVVGGTLPPGVAPQLVRTAMLGYDPIACAELARVFRERGTFQTPTLVANRAYYALPPMLGPDDPHRRLVARSVSAQWDSSRAKFLRNLPPPAVTAAQAALYRSRTALTSMFAHAGVPLLAGTDVADIYGIAPGVSLQDELKLLVAVGLTPLQALQSATLNPARYLHAADTLGLVAPGYAADMVLLDADPLADIGNVVRIRAVIARGRYLDRSSLDRLMELGERRAGAR